MIKLISSFGEGHDALEREVRANPGALVEVHEDVLRDLMTTSHPLERPRIGGRDGGMEKPRRRVCV